MSKAWFKHRILHAPNQILILAVTGRFAYKSIRLQVDSPTSRSFRLHWSRFANTKYLLLNTKYLSKNCGNVFQTSRYAEHFVSTNELINLKITNRNSSCTKRTENLKWYVCTPNYFAEANSRLSSVCHALMFCCARETRSRIFLSSVFCAYIEFYKITELLRALSLVDSCV